LFHMFKPLCKDRKNACIYFATILFCWLYKFSDYVDFSEFGIVSSRNTRAMHRRVSISHLLPAKTWKGEDERGKTDCFYVRNTRWHHGRTVVDRRLLGR